MEKRFIVTFSNGEKVLFTYDYEIEEYLKKHKGLEVVNGFAFPLEVNNGNKSWTSLAK